MTEFSEKLDSQNSYQEKVKPLHEFINFIDEGIFILNTENKIMLLNRKALELSGYNEGELIGKSITVLFPEALLKIDGIHLSDEYLDFNADLINKQGEKLSLKLNLKVKNWKNETIIFIKSKLIPKENENKFHAAFQVSPALMLIINAGNYQIEETSQALLNVLNYEKQELIGQDIRKIKIFENYSINRILEEIVRTKGFAQNIDQNIINRQGKIINALFSVNLGKVLGKEYFFLLFNDITKRRTIEEVFYEKAEQQQALLSSIPAYVYFKDRQSSFILANKTFTDMLNIENNSISGKNDYDFFPTAEADDFRSKDYQVIHSKTPIYNQEEKYTNPDGIQHLIVTSRVPYRNSDGKITGIIGTSIDIGKMKKTENELKKVTKLLQLTCAATKTGGWELKPKTQELIWTDEVFKIHGLELSKAPTLRGALNFFLPESKNRLIKALNLAASEYKSWDLELRLIDAGGKLVWVRLKGKPELKDGKLKGILGTIQDITETKKIIREKEAFFDISLDMICSMTLEGRFKQVNPFWSKHLGWDIEELRSQPIDKFLHPKDLKKTIRAINRVSPSQKLLQFENRFLCADHTYRWLSWRAYVDKQNKLIFAIARDVGEQKQLERKLTSAKKDAEKANRSKSKFLANASHEIRTPMNGIMGMTELALMTDLSFKQREYIEGIKVSAKSLLSIINDILDLSKIEAGKLKFEQIEFNLKEVAEESLNLVKLDAVEKSLKIDFEISAEIPDLLIGDPNRFKQILLNLLSNAVKFTNEGKVVLNIRALDIQNKLVKLLISVSDTGIGIPQNRHQKLFKAFNQADISIARKYGGSGLGLVISAQLAHLMGGTLNFKSEEGKGSNFSFDADFTIPENAEVDFEKLTGLKIVLLSQNQYFKDLISEVFAKNTNNVRYISDVHSILKCFNSKKIKKKPFDLIILDSISISLVEFEEFNQISREHKQPLLTLISPTDFNLLNQVDSSSKIAACLVQPIKAEDLKKSIAKIISSVERKASFKIIERKNIASTDRFTVLLVEDQEINRKISLYLLQKMELNIVIANDGQEAVDVWRNNDVDLILMDIQMPVMDGFEATKVIRKDQKIRNKFTPIIAMTAYATEADKEKCLAIGMDDYISKPITLETFQEKIEKYLTENNEETQSRSQACFEILKTDSDSIPPINVKELLISLGYDTRFLNELVISFIQEYPEKLKLMKLELELGKRNKLSRIAHSLKSATINLRMKKCTELLSELEECALIASREELGAIYLEIELELARIRRYFKTNNPFE